MHCSAGTESPAWEPAWAGHQPEAAGPGAGQAPEPAGLGAAWAGLGAGLAGMGVGFPEPDNETRITFARKLRMG